MNQLEEFGKHDYAPGTYLINIMPRITVSFYKYIIISDPYQFRDDLFAKWASFSVYGRTYVAKEGINAQISVPRI